MDILQKVLRPEALGWSAALLTLLTLLTFFNADMRRHAPAAPAGTGRQRRLHRLRHAAHLLPVLALHLALLPVNLLRLNQAFQRKPNTQPAEPTLAQRVARQPSGWTPARRASRVSRRPVGSAMSAQQSESGSGSGSSSSSSTRTDDTAAMSRGAPCKALIAMLRNPGLIPLIPQTLCS